MLLAVLFPLVMLITRHEKSRTVTISLFVLNIIFLIILYFMNDTLPFTGGGDDTNYYMASLKEFATASDWFNFKQFHTHDQPGYPMVLTWLNQFVGESLYLRKVINVEAFILLVVVWYGIGIEIGGVRVGQIFAMGVLLATPLWYYWMFVLKDMIIILLQSTFLYGAIVYLYKRNMIHSLILMLLSTLIVIPFRIQLVYLNAQIILIAFLIGFRESRGIAMRILLAALVLGSMIYISQNRNISTSLGIVSKTRSLDLNTMEKTANNYMKITAKYQSGGIFPVLFLVGEVAGFNPDAWKEFNMGLVRGVTAIPWIFIGVPLFLVGIFMIIFWKDKPPDGEMPPEQGASSEKKLQPKGGMLLLVGYVAIYYVLAWMTKDSTRWRMPGFPAMIAVAGWGWINLQRKTLTMLLICWGLPLSFSLVIFYVLFK
jgi:hypothetical protein